MAKDLRKLEAKLTREQIMAAQLLAINNFLPRNPDDGEQGRLTLDEIAEQAKCSISALYKWRHHNRDFIAYTNELSADAFMSHLPHIMEKHLDMTLKGQGSMKGIELFYKFGGLLIDRQEVKTEEGSTVQSLEDRLARLKERADSLKREGDE
ncbi:phBC6A51 family helix-turn-helix protein [Brevibacillus laterosporus]|uniref:phBC6A51 family helix-turn-helix protein n=1 Tax=Brevibacillus laterosporus TaxID=1465 RepID=UPI00264E9A5C|nr:phBC6A51 family helix-turn-helix protein [Brevibacillus laterosporus]MDN9010066.1 phBC6A51 family helix-turn-helix protein [Brevibacillus laterosporus]MDO0940552.1 phBC6A51 family helix-turn-helix protein [Brevibacillus laterosporus]